jgi:uncharacterized membrane protein YgcG
MASASPRTAHAFCHVYTREFAVYDVSILQKNGYISSIMIRAKILSLFLATTAIAAPLVASAQPAPTAPTYARPTVTTGEDVVHGRVVAFDGAYTLQVSDERGYIDSVQLRKGTIINPTGLTLSPGMIVTIRGVNSGSALVANEIDTPYTAYAAYPIYPYYGYPAYPYGFGPRFSLGFGFGGFRGGGFHGGGFHGGGFHGGGRFR